MCIEREVLPASRQPGTFPGPWNLPSEELFLANDTISPEGLFQAQVAGLGLHREKRGRQAPGLLRS